MYPTPDPVEHFFAWADAAQEATDLGDFRTAARKWQAAFTIFTEHERAFFNSDYPVSMLRASVHLKLANALSGYGNHVDALMHFDTSWEIHQEDLLGITKLDGDRVALQRNWAITLTRTGDFAEAISHFDTALKMHHEKLPGGRHLSEERASLHICLAESLYSIGHRLDALTHYEAAWRIHLKYLLGRRNLAQARANLQLNWGDALAGIEDYENALLRYQSAWDIHQKELTGRHDLANERALLHLNWGDVLSAKGAFSSAEKHYSAAWDMNLKDSVDPDLAVHCARLQVNWGRALCANDRYVDAIAHFQIARDIHDEVLQGQPDLASERVRLGMSWAYALERSSNYRAAATRYQETWNLLENKLEGLPAYAEQRARLQMNWAAALDRCGRHREALPHFQHAWDIHQKYLSADVQLAADRALLHANWGAAVRATGSTAGALAHYQSALEIHQKDLIGPHEQAGLHAMLLMNWGNALHYANDAHGAVMRYLDALRIFPKNFVNRPDLEEELASLLMNLSIALVDTGNSASALPLYQVGWDLLRGNLANYHRADCTRARLQMNWGNALSLSADFHGAVPHFEIAWAIHQKKLAGRLDLADDQAKIQMGWGAALYRTGDHAGALAHYEAARNCYGAGTLRRLEADVTLFVCALNEILCWVSMSDPHVRANELSHALRERLTLIVETNRPDWSDELYRQFIEFHVRWMRCCLPDEPERIPHILSLVSGWRIAQAILDELDHAEHASLPAPVAAFRKLRLELDQIRLQLKALEQAPSEMGAARPVSPEQQEQIHQLRRTYDSTYGAMLVALEQAKTFPDYAALATDMGFDTLSLQHALQQGEGAAFFVDFPQSDFRGILLLSKHSADWFELADPAGGMARLAYFNRHFARGRGYRGSNNEPPTPLDAEQALTLSPAAFWPDLKRWVDQSLWTPLAAALNEKNITHLNLVTQGRTHSIPWEMGAPQGLVLSRYPGLTIFSMQRDLMPCPAHHMNKKLGLAASRAANIPRAAREVEIIQAMWAKDGIYPFDYLKPPAEVEAVHLAGHGFHDDDRPQHAALEMGGEGEATWTLPQLMASCARPLRVFISACVAGRTTESGEGDLYGVSAALMLRGVRELGGAVVNMHDTWMEVLGVSVQQRLLADRSLSQRMALAQAKEALLRGDALPLEIEAEWQNDFGKRIAKVVISVINDANDDDPIDVVRRVAQESLRTNEDVLDIDSNAFGDWIGGVIAAGKVVGRYADIEGQMAFIVANPIAFRTTPPEPILGALLYAVLHFGQ